MTETAFDIDKYDFDAVDQEVNEKSKKSFNIDSYDFNTVEKDIAAREETEKRGLVGDIISAPVRGVAVEMPSLFLDAAAATERITRKVFGAEKETGLIGEFAKAGKEGLEEFRSTHPILRAKESLVLYPKVLKQRPCP